MSDNGHQAPRRVGPTLKGVLIGSGVLVVLAAVNIYALGNFDARFSREANLLITAVAVACLAALAAAGALLAVMWMGYGGRNVDRTAQTWIGGLVGVSAPVLMYAAMALCGWLGATNLFLALGVLIVLGGVVGFVLLWLVHGLGVWRSRRT